MCRRGCLNAKKAAYKKGPSDLHSIVGTRPRSDALAYKLRKPFLQGMQATKMILKPTSADRDISCCAYRALLMTDNIKVIVTKRTTGIYAY